MSFSTDQQTLNDLNILGRPGVHSVFDTYNNTTTRKGAEMLEQLFRHPLSDAVEINTRSCIFRYFTTIDTSFPLASELIDHAELYLEMNDERTRLTMEADTLGRKVGNFIAADPNYMAIHNGILATIEILHTLQAFLQRIASSAAATPYETEREALSQLIAHDGIVVLLQEKARNKLSYAKVVEYDKLLRFGPAFRMKEVLAYVYRLDVYMSVARVAVKNQLTFPVALDKALHTVRLEGVYHPHVKNAVPNTIHITSDNNVIFLTGANMAGKSTFMKSMGIALFVAHMGFPVAAASMEFSVRDGIFTTINLPDDLDMGSSHFYAEVLRLKKIAKEVGMAKNLFIIFDELFRGTNVKDAYEATVAITTAFAKKRNSMFVVSTHIIEAGEVLKERCTNIHFTYLPTRMNKNTPVYTYTLEQGITADRHGMIIIQNEGILDIIKSRKTKTAVS